MTGLDKIVEKILQEADTDCRKIIDDAENQVNKIIADSRTEANEKSSEIINSAKTEAALKNSIAKGSAESITKSKYLAVKNAIINDILSAAYEKICEMPDDKYFDMLFKLCVKNIQNGECVMRLNQHDIDRLPENFEDSINQQVYETSAVFVSKEPIDIENGFVLVYGDIEINCTLKAIFDDSIDGLKDKLCPMLFE